MEDLDVTRDLSTALAGYLDAAGWDVLRLSDPEEIGQGWESTIHTFTVTASDGTERDIVLRRYSGPAGGAKAVREFEGMRYLGSGGYPVPEVLAVEPDPGPVGTPFILMERVDGDTMWPLIFPAGGGVDRDLFGLFVDLAVRLHRFERDGFRGKPASVEAQLGEWRAASAEHPMPGFDAALAWLDARAGSVAPMEPAVVHWDYHPENVLYDNGTVNVIDWTQVGVSDPRFDLAWTMLLVGTYQGEEHRDAIRNEYEERSGASVPSLGFFDAAVSVKRLYSVTVSLLAGPEALGMQPEAAVQMREQVEPLGSVYRLFQERTGLTIPEVERVLSS